MIGIYKITSPTNRVYIGQAINIKVRTQKYNCLKAISKQPKIFRSIKKYGIENHKFEMIEECELFQLDERETYHKQQFVNEFGWKMTLFCKLYDCVKDKHLPQSVKNKIGRSNKGKIRTEETKLKLTKVRTRGKQCKPAYQYDLDGNFIKKWEYREDAEKFHNQGKLSNHITQCILGKIQKAYNFQWKSFYEQKISPYTPNYNPIIQLDILDNPIKIWNNMSEAEKYFNPKSFIINKYGANNIRACIQGRQQTAYGFKWKNE